MILPIYHLIKSGALGIKSCQGKYSFLCRSILMDKAKRKILLYNFFYIRTHTQCYFVAKTTPLFWLTLAVAKLRLSVLRSMGVWGDKPHAFFMGWGTICSACYSLCNDIGSACYFGGVYIHSQCLLVGCRRKPKSRKRKARTGVPLAVSLGSAWAPRSLARLGSSLYNTYIYIFY